jgi:hypothetical protein
LIKRKIRRGESQEFRNGEKGAKITRNLSSFITADMQPTGNLDDESC